MIKLMKKSELKKLIREEIKKLNEIKPVYHYKGDDKLVSLKVRQDPKKIRQALLKQFGKDPLYKEFILAKTPKESKEKLDTLVSIRGPNALTLMKKFIKKFIDKVYGESKLNEGKVYDIDSVKDAMKVLKSKIKAPYFSIQYSTLSGDKDVSILFTVGMDDKKDWPHGYIENSKYARFYFDNNGKIESFSGSKFLTKFRKATVKSPGDAAKKVNQFIAKG